MPVRLPRWLRLTLFLLTLFLAIGLTVYGIRQAIKPVTLKLAMGSMGADAFNAYMAGGPRDDAALSAAIDVFGDVLANYVNAMFETRLGVLYLNSLIVATATCLALFGLIVFAGEAMSSM